MSRYAPERGEIVWLDLDPQAGHEQAGRRPVLVLSPRAFNALGTALVVPITNRIRGGRFEVAFPDGADATGVVLCQQVKALDIRSRRAEPKGRADPDTLREVTRRILPLIDPDGEFILLGDD